MSSDYCKKNLQTLSSLFNKEFQISLVWLPAHCGIPGNERADLFAKEGASESDSFERSIQPHEFLHIP